MRAFRKIVAGLACAGAVAAAAPAFSAEAAPAPSAHNLELARQLFAEMHMDRMMDSMMKAMIPAMTEQARKANPGLTADQSQAVNEAVVESSRGLMAKLTDRMIPLYASTFSQKELEDTVAFYGSPSGQAMLAKMPELAQRMAPMMVELMPEVTADVRTRICAKIDCSATKTPPRSGT